MASTIKKILIVGGTSGLGEAFARRFHAAGAYVIVTGRRTAQLDKLANTLQHKVSTYTWDVSDFASIPSTASRILSEHPDTDAVFLNAGIQKSFLWADPSSSSDADIIREVNTNVTAPYLLTRVFFPYLLKRASGGQPAALLATSSGLAFLSMPFYPVYCATKAAVHFHMVALRQQIAMHSDPEVKKNLSICEVAPPWVDTALDAEHRPAEFEEGARRPMPLDEYIDQAMQKIGELDDGKLKKEVLVGFSEMGGSAWRGAFGPALEKIGFPDSY